MSVEPFPITKLEARRIWLRAQRLDTSAPFGDGPQATAAAVEHLGYVQIDTINVIERSHHHILWTRIPDYRRADLQQSQSVDKTVFEYWTHALSYVPSRDLRFFLPAMKRHRREGHKWLAGVSPADLRKVMRLIRRDGALTIRDIEDDVLVDKHHPWASRKPSKRALQLAFYTGELTISARAGMLKTYELMARHFGWDKPPKPASPREVIAYLLDRALRAQGVVSLDSICHLDAPSKSAVRRLIEVRMRAKELVPVALEGAGKQEHWAHPEVLEGAHVASRDATPGLVHILSPFDPLTIQRKRTELFFGYGHRFEAYLPKEKRLFGYFALPVLAGDRIVAAVDLKTDRKARKLLMQKWSWVDEDTGLPKTQGAGARGDLKRRIEEELHRFERFQLADGVSLSEPGAPSGVSPDERLPGRRAMGDEKMGDDKSIRQRIADTLKDLANIAANAANDAMKAEAPKPMSNEAAASYIPFAAEGLVSDPLLVPPLAAASARRKKGGAAKSSASKDVRKTAKKAARKSVAGKSKKRNGQTAKKAAKKTAKKTTNKTTTKNKKRATHKARKSTRRKRAKA